MATDEVEDMPLEGPSGLKQQEDDGEEYAPELAEQKQQEKLKYQQEERSRNKSPTPVDGTLSKNEIECKVFLLNGEVTSVIVDRKIKAADLVERIHTEVDVYEKDYFALYFIENNQKIFLEAHKCVKDQVPASMRNSWRLKYGVKFYLSDPSMLKEDISRYQYCLQLCQDIKENRVLTDRETATRLTGLMLQANLGDYDPEEHKEGYTKNFLEFILLPSDELPDNYESQVVEVHKAKTGYTPSQSESEFLQIAKKLTRYGMHLFVARDKTRSLILVGISYRGISIYRDHIETAKYPWPNVNKIAYKRHKFVIRYRTNDSKGDLTSLSSNTDPMGAKQSGDIQITKLYTGNPPASKRIWKCAVEQHTFFRLQVPERPSRLQQVFRRGSKFRYSGRTFKQLQAAKDDDREEPNFIRTHSERLRENPRKQFAPGYVPARNSFRAKKPVATRQFVVGKQDPRLKDWVLLNSPPFIDENKNKNYYEEQLVQVKFRLKDGLPDSSHKFVIVKRNNKYEMERVGAKGENEPTEQTFNLTPVNPKSTTATTHVSIHLDPKPINVAPRGSVSRDSIPIYDSTKIPDVDLRQSGQIDRGVEDVTSVRTVHSNSQTPQAKGAVLRQYPESTAWPLRFNAPTDEEDEAAQVQIFLNREREIISHVITTQ